MKRQIQSFSTGHKRQKTQIQDLSKAQEQQQTQIQNLSETHREQHVEIQDLQHRQDQQDQQISQLQRHPNTTAASVDMGNVFHAIKVSNGRLRCPMASTKYVSVSKNFIINIE